MIAVIERTSGYTIARNGQVLAHITNTEANELNTALTESFKPLSPKAVTPAKYAARKRPPIQVYPAKAAA